MKRNLVVNFGGKDLCCSQTVNYGISNLKKDDVEIIYWLSSIKKVGSFGSQKCMERKTAFVLGEEGWQPLTSTHSPLVVKQFPTITIETQPPRPQVHCSVPSLVKAILLLPLDQSLRLLHSACRPSISS